MFRRKNEICFLCRLLSLLCTLTFGGFYGQHIFHQFCHIFNKLFFSIKWCIPNVMDPPRVYDMYSITDQNIFVLLQS